jgi:hypothetical protein
MDERDYTGGMSALQRTFGKNRLKKSDSGV